MGGFYFFLTLFALCFSACASSGPIKLDPSVLNPNTKKIKGQHLVYQTDQERNGKLVVTLGGTGSTLSDFRALQKFAVSLGYDVLAIDYWNDVTTIKCRLDKSLNCFEHLSGMKTPYRIIR